MGKPIEDIRIRINYPVDEDLENDLEIVPKHEPPVADFGPIKLFSFNVIGKNIEVKQSQYANVEGRTALDIVEQFIRNGSVGGERIAAFVAKNGPSPLVDDDVLTSGKPGTSQFDIAVLGQEVYLFDISIPTLFVDPKILSFERGEFHPHYGNCRVSDDGKRFAFAARGDAAHRKSFKRKEVDSNGTEIEVEQRHKFNLHLVLTDSADTVHPDERLLTRIIVDPKARDGGFP